MSGVFPFTSRFLTAPDYVLTLHQPENRVAILVRNRARAQTIQRILLAEDIADSRIQDWLKEQNNAGADIFLGMNPLRANSFARTKESVREIRHVYLDLDADAPASLRTIRTDGNTPVPTFVLDTSPEKNQVVWRVDGLDRQAAEVLMRSLANQFQGDIAATDIARVLRIPGFANRKYNEAFVVRAIQQSDAIYHLRDFAIHEDSPEAPRRVSEGLRRATQNAIRPSQPIRSGLGVRQTCTRPWRRPAGNHPAYRRLQVGRQSRPALLRETHSGKSSGGFS